MAHGKNFLLPCYVFCPTPFHASIVPVCLREGKLFLKPAVPSSSCLWQFLCVCIAPSRHYVPGEVLRLHCTLAVLRGTLRKALQSWGVELVCNGSADQLTAKRAKSSKQQQQQSLRMQFKTIQIKYTNVRFAPRSK